MIVGSVRTLDAGSLFGNVELVDGASCTFEVPSGQDLLVAKVSLFIDGKGSGTGTGDVVLTARVFDGSSALIGESNPVTIADGQQPGVVDFVFANPPLWKWDGTDTGMTVALHVVSGSIS